MPFGDSTLPALKVACMTLQHLQRHVVPGAQRDAPTSHLSDADY